MIEEVKLIPTYQLHVSVWNVRIMAHSDVETEEFKSLVQSIKSCGLLQPLIVTPNKGGYGVVVGQRRYKACKKLKLKEIPCIVKHLTDEECVKYSLVENKQRKNVDPIDFAEGLRQLVDMRGGTSRSAITVIAREVGLSEPSIWRYLSLTGLSPEVKEKVKRGRLGVKIGSQLSALSTGSQEDVVGHILEKSFPEESEDKYKFPEHVVENIIRTKKKQPKRNVKEIIEEIHSEKQVVFEIRFPDKSKMEFNFPLKKWNILYKRAKALNKTPCNLIMSIIEKWIGEIK